METERALEFGATEMRRLVDLAMDRITAHLASLPDQPTAVTEGGLELARSLEEPIPEQGEPIEGLLDLLFERVIPHSFNSASPGYLAYVPGGGIFHAALADLIANAVNRYVGVWSAAPGLVQLETNVLRWFAGIFGYPRGSSGILTTGGSLANWTAIVTARRSRLPEDFLAGTLYASDQVHHSVEKAAMLAGFPQDRARIVESDARYRMRLDRLEEAIAEDRRRGLRPFLVVGSAGTTNTGAVDDLEGLARLARREGLWVHVDAAYGGFFALTDRGRSALAGIEEADSIAVDPHKGLFLPYGNGALLVRDPSALARAHRSPAAYLPEVPDSADVFNFADLSPELSRDFRGLRVWLPLKMHGIGVFRRALDEKLDLARLACKALRGIPGIEILDEPQLSIVAFRLANPADDGAATDRRNRALLERINASGRVFLSGTVLRERFVLRLCVLHFRTHRDRVEEMIEIVRRCARETSVSP